MTPQAVPSKDWEQQAMIKLNQSYKATPTATRRSVKESTKTVVRTMVEIVEPQAGMSIYDPTVGSGGMLIQSRDYITECGNFGTPRAGISIFSEGKLLTMNASPSCDKVVSLAISLSPEGTLEDVDLACLCP